MEYIIMILSCVLVNNIILAQFLGICSFLGVSNKVSTSLGMGMAVIFVMALSTLVTSLLQKYLLVPFNLTFLQTIVFILVIATLVQ
ncbi:MAG TPA: Rnf-Nqr domain containing protein, partial [Bacteroidales bacterium]|nr:Rnf-Nqr domain containing protein [Bacteroidales bacterium]